MEYCAYIYTPSLRDAHIRSLLTGLHETEIAISHLGKHDPPRKWSGDDEAAASEIVSGTDATNWTFLEDRKSGLGFSIQLHCDPRWEHDTVSLSGAMEHRVRQVAEAIADRIPHYAAIIGLVNGGKNQAWRVLRMSHDCPDRLRNRFAKTDPDGATNASLPHR